MKATESPLVSLAWSALPEDALVRRLANEILKKPLRWTDVPDDYRQKEANKTITKMVRETYAPPGKKQARLRAVTKEMTRQLVILKERAKLIEYQSRHHDFNEYLRKDKSHRLSRVAERMFGTMFRVFKMKKTHDGYYFFLSDGGIGCHTLLVRRPDGSTHRYISPVSLPSITRAAMSMIPYENYEEAALDGAAFSYDLRHGRTEIAHPDGTVEFYEWPEFDAPYDRQLPR